MTQPDPSSKMNEQDSDLLESLLGRAQERTSDHLDRRMREAHEIKNQEETASQRRLEEMWVREHERQRAIAASQAEQRRQEQMMVRYVFVGAVIVIVIILLVTVFLSLMG